MQQIETWLSLISNYINKLSKCILFIVVIAMFSAVFLQVFFRYVVGYSLAWSEEVTMFLMAWMTFIGSAIALKHWQHISVDIIPGLVKGKNSIILSMIIKIITFMFFYYLLTGGWNFAVGSRNIYADGINLSLFWPRLSMVIGSLFMLVHLLYMLISDYNSLITVRGNDK